MYCTLLAIELCSDDAGRSVEAELGDWSSNCAREPGKTASAIAAHLGLTAIAVVISHLEIGAVGGIFQQEYSVSSDAAMTIAQKCDFIRVQPNVPRTIIQQNEIVPGAVHFRKREHRSQHNYVVVTNSK